MFSYKELDYIFFSVIYTLYSVQYYFPNFKHNDLKANNILLKKTDKKYIEFTVVDDYIHRKDSGRGKNNNKKFKFETFGYIIKLADLDFSCIKDKVNNSKC